jgi:hypothetical protein
MSSPPDITRRDSTNKDCSVKEMKAPLPIYIAAFLLIALGRGAAVEPDVMPRFVETLEKKEATHSLTVTWSLPGVVERHIETAYFRRPRDKKDVGFNGGKVGTADGKTGGFSSQMRAVPKADVIDVSLRITWMVRPANGSNSLEIPVKYAESEKGSIAGLTYEVSWKELKK